MFPFIFLAEKSGTIAIFVAVACAVVNDFTERFCNRQDSPKKKLIFLQIPILLNTLLYFIAFCYSYRANIYPSAFTLEYHKLLLVAKATIGIGLFLIVVRAVGVGMEVLLNREKPVLNAANNKS